MKNRSFGFFSLVFAAILWSGLTAFSAGDDTAAMVASAIQAGNATEVSRYFNSMVDLTLPGYDDTYSKAQASQIIKDFFSQNPVKSFKVTRQGSSPDGSKYMIGSLDTGKKVYRVYFLIKSVNGQNLVHQLQFQES